MNQREQNIASLEISKVMTFNLGGYQQKVAIEGKVLDLPVLLTLHGGPGTPMPFSVGCRGLFPELTSKFIMVYWDQLGCGINNYPIDDSFTIDSFVIMVEDLLKELKSMFPNNKIMIFSISWGTILSLKLLQKNPKAVDAVFACGQIIKDVFYNDEVFEVLEKSSLSKKKLAKIKNVDINNIAPKDLKLISSSIKKYTDGYQNKKDDKMPMGFLIKGLFSSTDYSFKDFIAVLKNGYSKNQSLWKEILKLDLSETLMKVEIPYYILQGETDIVASTSLIQKLLSQRDNKNLLCKIIRNAGHMPSNMIKEFFDIINNS